MATDLGATQLRDSGSFRVFADPGGHPFCLYPDPDPRDTSDRPLSGAIGHIVFDCFSPRALASFYAKLLAMPERLQDDPSWVVTGGADRRPPYLAFQHTAAPPPRWPDPAFPQQMHLDLDAEAGGATDQLALELGAIRLADLGGSCPIYADPAGHPFCLCTPDQ